MLTFAPYVNFNAISADGPTHVIPCKSIVKVPELTVAALSVATSFNSVTVLPLIPCAAVMAASTVS